MHHDASVKHHTGVHIRDLLYTCDHISHGMPTCLQ